MLTVRLRLLWMDHAAVANGLCGSRGSRDRRSGRRWKGYSVKRGPSSSSCAFPRVGPQELIDHKDDRPLAKLSRLVRERYRGLTLEQSACAKFLLPSVRRVCYDDFIPKLTLRCVVRHRIAALTSSWSRSSPWRTRPATGWSRPSRSS